MAAQSANFWAGVAERRRTAVRLNLEELNALLEAGLDAGAALRKNRKSVLTRACRRVEAARNRRLAAVERALRRAA